MDDVLAVNIGQTPPEKAARATCDYLPTYLPRPLPSVLRSYDIHGQAYDDIPGFLLIHSIYYRYYYYYLLSIPVVYIGQDDLDENKPPYPCL